jgi:hypothetical protein
MDPTINLYNIFLNIYWKQLTNNQPVNRKKNQYSFSCANLPNNQSTIKLKYQLANRQSNNQPTTFCLKNESTTNRFQYRLANCQSNNQPTTICFKIKSTINRFQYRLANRQSNNKPPFVFCQTNNQLNLFRFGKIISTINHFLYRSRTIYKLYPYRLKSN